MFLHHSIFDKKDRRTKEYLDTITEDSAMPLSQSVATERTII
jgi:hypothetical protein